jgi:hypothetical protein
MSAGSRTIQRGRNVLWLLSHAWSAHFRQSYYRRRRHQFCACTILYTDLVQEASFEDVKKRKKYDQRELIDKAASVVSMSTLLN